MSRAKDINERGLFSQISKNWRGRPLESLVVIVGLIASTTTRDGPRVRCGVDTREFEMGAKATDEGMGSLDFEPYEWHGDWNYVIKPRLQLPLGDADTSDAVV